MAFPTLTVEFAPGYGPFSTTPVWVNISSRVLSAEWRDGKQADLSEFPPGEATVVLANHDRLFDPEHATGTYYGNLKPRVPFRIRATHTDNNELLWDGEALTWGGETLGWDITTSTYDLFFGFVEDGWEQTLRPPKDSTCTVRLVDMLSVLASYKLGSALSEEVATDTPVSYWTLDEADGIVMGDRSGNGLHGTFDNVLQGEDPLIVDSAGKSVYAAHVGDNRCQYKGTKLPTQAPVTLEAWVKIPTRDLTQTRTILVAQRDNAYGSGLWVGVETSANGSPDGELVVNFFGLGGFYKARGHIRIDDGEIHHVVMTMASTAAVDIKLYVDGVVQTKTVISGTTGGTWTGHHIWCVGNVAASAAFDFGLEGFVDEVAVYSSAISAARVTSHYQAGRYGLEGSRSDVQVKWILDTIGVPAALQSLDVGRSIMGPMQITGRGAMEVIRELVDTEWGGFFVAHHDAGKLKFRQRYASFQDTRSTVAQASFTDEWSATGARVEPGTLRVDPNGIQTVINQATVTWRGGTETYDESTGSAYGPRGIQVDTQAASPDLARGLGSWIVNLNSEPAAKIRSLGINPAAAQTQFTIALGTRIGDRATYRSHPQSVGAATTKQLEVLGRKHAVQGLHWLSEFYLTAAPNVGVTLFTLGTSQLGGSHILAY